MTTLPPPENRERPGPALWFALLGGAAAWAVQFLTGYLVTESMCVAAQRSASAEQAAGALTGATVAVLVVSLAAFAVAVAAALAGRRVWRRSEERTDERGEVRTGGMGWTAFAGMLLSGVFAFIILAQVLPLFIAGGCA